MLIQSSLKRFIVFATVVAPRLCLGWGADGHRLVATVGSQQATQAGLFWSANAANMATLTTVPDRVWKSLPTASVEKPTHFFQPDSYVSDPTQFDLIPRNYDEAVTQKTQAFVDKNGTSVWRVYQLYKLAVAAIQRNDFVTGVEMAGAMSHYFGDMAQPLHDTHDFDGPNQTSTGIHKFYEVDNLSPNMESAVTEAAKALLQNQEFLADFQGSIVDISFAEVKRAFVYKDTLLSIDQQYGRTGQGAQMLANQAVQRMADGAATLALVLERLWVEAGSPTGGASVGISDPAWVAPDYKNLLLPNDPVATALEDDDCGS